MGYIGFEAAGALAASLDLVAFMAHVPLSFVLHPNAATWSQHPLNFNQGSISAVFPVPISDTTKQPYLEYRLASYGLLTHLFSSWTK